MMPPLTLRPVLRGLLPLACLLLSGCESPAPSAAAGELSCTAVTQPADSAGGLVSALALHDDGGLAWVDPSSTPLIHVQSPAGRTDSYGRRGKGPGEYQTVTGLGWLDGTLWASDLRLGRVTYLSSEGEPLEIVNTGVPANWVPLGDSTLVGTPPALVRQIERFVLRLDLRTARPDTLIAVAGPPIDRFELDLGGGTRSIGIQPLGEYAVVDGSPSGNRWCSVMPLERADAVRLQCLAPDGAVQLDREITTPPEPLTDADYNSVVALFLEAMPNADRAAVEHAVARPASLPRVARMVVSDAGEVWLQRSSSRSTVERWLKLGPDGEPRGEMTLPPDHSLRILRDDVVLTVATDSNGVQHVERCER